jgi:16S rRNA (uracil1498-N3)-methyltransferase
MSLRRIWLDLAEGRLHEGVELELPSSHETYHHAVNVSRFSVGDSFEAITGGPDAYHLRIVALNKKSIKVRVVGQRQLAKPLQPNINLAFAVSKWETTENVIEKCVELGVGEFWPLLTENSFAKAAKEISSSRLERWHKIVRSATTQTARGALMRLKVPSSLEDFLLIVNRDKSAVCLFGYEGPCQIDVREALQGLLVKSPQTLWALVGSEGGFSDAEVLKIKSFGIEPATMGPQILRAETACLAMVSVIKYESGLMK